MQSENLVFGIHPILSLLKLHPQRVKQLYIQQERHDKRLQEIIALAEHHHISVQEINKKKLDSLLPNEQHQGVIADCQKAISYHEDDIEKLLSELNAPPFLLILDEVQDPHNLGACLRSANAAGVNLVIAPKDNSATITPVVRKVACGAADITPFIQVTNLARTLSSLKEQGIWLYGTAGEAESSLFDTDLRGAVALVLGAEGKGLRRLTRESCDYLISIPMVGSVESLNVSVATGICCFEVLRQRSQGSPGDRREPGVGL